MRNKLLIIIIFINLIVSSPVWARNLCQDMKLGWHFYCDDKKFKLEDTSNTVKTPNIAQAKQELKAIQTKLEDLKILSVMYPTDANVFNYIAFQQEQLERAGLFSDAWKKVLWKTPNLDYMVKTPINSIGNSLRNDIASNGIKETLSKLGQRYGLFFFYNSSCAYCQRYSPVLKVFADHYNIEVMAITMDELTLPEWPSSTINHGQTKTFNIDGKPVPATILFDNITHQLIPVGFGLLTVTDLEERIYELTKGI